MLDFLEGWKRTHRNHALRLSDKDTVVTLMGWVETVRDHGGLIFVDLRDRYGITQLVFNPEHQMESYKKAETLRREYVVAVQGKVEPRMDGMTNPKLPTGEIEVLVDTLKILNTSEPPVFGVSANDETPGEEIRLKHRYLDLRRPQMQRNLQIRHDAYQVTRRYFTERDFLEVETPMLMKSTPEGARDYLVPSRVWGGKFYALPQSPQTYKQLLMIAGCERYFQIVKCFRDEDLRADRQPEFTQIDVEMSFVEETDVRDIAFNLTKQIFKEVLDNDTDFELPIIPYKEAIEKYGTDRPDLRWGLTFENFNDVFAGSDFKVFRGIVEGGGNVIGLKVPGGAAMSRKKLDDLVEYVTRLGGSGMAWFKFNEDGVQSPVAKFLGDERLAQMGEIAGAETGDLVVMQAGAGQQPYDLLGNLRIEIIRVNEYEPEKPYAFCWVNEFPLVEKDEDAGRFMAVHHPFTSPRDEDLETLENDPGAVLAKAYDLVLNGLEIAGGSIRIHRQDVQSRMFELLNIGKEEAQSKFGFLLDALQCGAPPHGGIAFGFDRLVMILAGEDTIREVIAFPKTASAMSPMDGAPSEVDQEQLKELSLRLSLPHKK
jgi:aspartyl-tRNA synthetase